MSTPVRDPGAWADIAAARAAPTDMEIAMQELDRAHEQALKDEETGGPTAYRAHGEGDIGPAEVVGLNTALSNAALADTPAVKQYGPAPVRGETPPLPPDAIVLTGPGADRYRALQTAARAATEATRAAQSAGAALRDAFQAFCTSVGDKEP